MSFVRVLFVLVVLVLLGGLFREEIAKSYKVVRLYAQPPDPSIAMPVEGVRRSAVADTWHAPRSGGRRHEGQDIFARRGTAVLSATDGVVVRLGGGKLGGNAVFVAGRGRRVYYYAHLDRYAEGIDSGTVVTRGDVLGYVGNTGNARTTPPHLHFGVYSASGAINPLNLIESPQQHGVETAGD